SSHPASPGSPRWKSTVAARFCLRNDIEMKRENINYLFLCFFTVFLSFSSFAQDEEAVKLADEMYNYGDRKDALEVYLQALHINKDNLRANLMAGICNLLNIYCMLMI
ncbi:MAG: hypothetical protein SNJ77_04700, partial [Cytophagales bacterium]